MANSTTDNPQPGQTGLIEIPDAESSQADEAGQPRTKGSRLEGLKTVMPCRARDQCDPCASHLPWLRGEPSAITPRPPRLEPHRSTRTGLHELGSCTGRSSKVEVSSPPVGDGHVARPARSCRETSTAKYCCISVGLCSISRPPTWLAFRLRLILISEMGGSRPPGLRVRGGGCRAQAAPRVAGGSGEREPPERKSIFVFGERPGMLKSRPSWS
jgi:hypothetical protein